MRNFKAEIFQALAHPTRLAILEALRDGELSVGGIMIRLEIEQANLSQHLAILRSRRLLANRKAGNQVFYSVRDPLILKALEIMRRYAIAHLSEDMEILAEMKAEEPRR